MRFHTKSPDYKKYNRLLKEENEKLTQKITQFEQEQTRITAEKEKALNMLNRYKSEYESLIQDARHLLQKQKESDKVMSNLIEKLRGECSDLLSGFNTNK